MALSSGMTPEALMEMLSQARQAGFNEGMNNHPVTDGPNRGLVDTLKDLVDYGDLVIRKVGNGHIIRRIPHVNGARIETWVVEGDMSEVAKQLTAITATEAMLNADRDREYNVALGAGSPTGMSHAQPIDKNAGRTAIMPAPAKLNGEVFDQMVRMYGPKNSIIK